jgi:hypothetical protein
MAYQIDSFSPSEALLRAIFAAGHAIECCIDRVQGPPGVPGGFKWIKAEWRWPAFDHITLAYKDQVFSIIVTLDEDLRSASRGRDALRCAQACDEFGLVPCIFPVSPSGLGPARPGWNLYDIRDLRPVDPLELAGNARIPMSEWEMRSVAIQCVLGHLKEVESARIDSCCDVLDIDPQIWFVDKAERLNWVAVRCHRGLDDTRKIDWASVLSVTPQIAAYQGFGAAVSIASAAPVLRDAEGVLIPLSRRFDESAPVYRGDELYVAFEGLEKIRVM